MCNNAQQGLCDVQESYTEELEVCSSLPLLLLLLLLHDLLAPSSIWFVCFETRFWPEFQTDRELKRCHVVQTQTDSGCFESFAPEFGADPVWTRCGSASALLWLRIRRGCLKPLGLFWKWFQSSCRFLYLFQLKQKRKTRWDYFNWSVYDSFCHISQSCLKMIFL